MGSVDWTITQGDTQPGVTDTLEYEDGSSPDLTGGTVNFIARSPTASQPFINASSTGQNVLGTGTARIVHPTQPAVVAYVPSAADTATAGDFMFNWRIVLANGSTITDPTDGYFWWRIRPSLLNLTGEYLVSLPEVKDYLNSFGIDHSHDAKLLGYIQAATPVIENIVGPVIVRTIEEWHDGGQYWITLRRKPSFALGTTPVLQILGCDEYRGPIKYPLSVITDPTAAGIYSCMLDQRTGTLYRRTTGGGVIPFGAGAWGGGMPQAVHVVYQTGQATVPANVRMATLEAIREFYQNTMPTGSGSRSLVDTYDTASTQGFATYLDRYARGALAPMRRHPSIA